MRYIKPKFHRKQLRKAERSGFADGLLVGFAVVAAIILIND